MLISVSVTSSEVKKRLHEFVISKKQKDLAIASLSGAQAFKHWLVRKILLFFEIEVTFFLYLEFVLLHGYSNYFYRSKFFAN